MTGEVDAHRTLVNNSFIWFTISLLVFLTKRKRAIAVDCSYFYLMFILKLS